MWMAQTFAEPMPLGSWMESPSGWIPADSLALVALAHRKFCLDGVRLGQSFRLTKSSPWTMRLFNLCLFVGEELSILGLEQGSVLTSNTCVLVEAPTWVGAQRSTSIWRSQLHSLGRPFLRGA